MLLWSVSKNSFSSSVAELQMLLVQALKGKFCARQSSRVWICLCSQPGRDIVIIYWIISCSHFLIFFFGFFFKYSSSAGGSILLKGENQVTYWQCTTPFPFRSLQPCKLGLMVSTKYFLCIGSIKSVLWAESISYRKDAWNWCSPSFSAIGKRSVSSVGVPTWQCMESCVSDSIGWFFLKCFLPTRNRSLLFTSWPFLTPREVKQVTQALSNSSFALY